MPTAMAIVLLGGLRSLMPVITLAEMGNGAEVVECLYLKRCWEDESQGLHDGREENPL